ncbi:9562_t:CDS:2 [Diversispora eburnea]|uniref:9562_t:CDS:1 n=1 Tax=Diversispora eburnea TaxID=1213867 RepID=A0A9N8UYH2_9GLOM|nr:9562_t:CDS:2 [Diversispora eburnea]
MYSSIVLTADVLHDIFKFFKNDQKTLYSLVRVNHLWCYQAIPLLWSKPFDMTTQDRYYEIIQTYVTCLPEHIKSHLVYAGIKLSTNYSHNQPFFDYPSYLQHFDSDKFNRALNIWLRITLINENYVDPLLIFCGPLKKILGPIVKDCYIIYPQNILQRTLNKCLEPVIKDYYSKNPKYNLFKEITHLIFSRCNRLKSLLVYVGDEHTLSLVDMDFSLLTRRHNALLSLQKFELTLRTPPSSSHSPPSSSSSSSPSSHSHSPSSPHSPPSSSSSSSPSSHSHSPSSSSKDDILTNLFTMMSTFATNIQEITIQSYTTKLPSQVHSSLYRMIESQKSLQSFMSNYFWDVTYPSLFKALLNQSRSLTKFRLWGLTNIDNSLVIGLLEWDALETFELMGCPISSLPDNFFDSFSNGQLKIKNFFLGNGYGSYPFITNGLLKMINLNLQKLVVEGITPEIVEAVRENCPQLTHLSICAYQSIHQTLPRLLSSLSLLETLILGNQEQFLYTSDTLIQFSQSIPSSLCTLFLNFNISSLSLKVILKECQASLNILELHQIQSKEYELFSILIQYSKENENLKELKLYLANNFRYSENNIKYIDYFVDYM